MMQQEIDTTDPALWWKQAVVYQVYPRSFKDSRGSGLGSIAGVTEKIDYLAELGVDAIWLSPFYPSQLADGGYDVDDYRNVDPKLGTMDDFDELARAAHERNIKVVVDIVPNHSSNLHEWFKAALDAAPGSPERDRYIFRDGKGPNGDQPPTDWIASFGGPAWTRVPDGQWYLHMFTKEQPDWNWRNPEVRADFIKTLRFWLDHGADGFRVDVAHGLAKDLDRDDLESYKVCEHVLPSDGSHPLYDRDEVHDIYREWRKVFNEYNPPAFAVAEAWVNPDRQHLYASTEELGQVFNFEFAKKDWIRDDMHLAIEEGLESAERSGSSATWVMSNHDVPRMSAVMDCHRFLPRRIISWPRIGWSAMGRVTLRTANSVPSVPAPRFLWNLPCLAPPTFIRVRNWDCRKSRIFLGTSWRIPPRSTACASKPKRAVTAAECRCRGSPPTLRSSMIPMTNSATMVLSASLLRVPNMIRTFHSRSGTRISPLTWRMPTRIPC